MSIDHGATLHLFGRWLQGRPKLLKIQSPMYTRSNAKGSVIFRSSYGMFYSSLRSNLSDFSEGETEEQRQFLQDNGCTQYQGYQFGNQVPIEEFGLC